MSVKENQDSETAKGKYNGIIVDRILKFKKMPKINNWVTTDLQSLYKSKQVITATNPDRMSSKSKIKWKDRQIKKNWQQKSKSGSKIKNGATKTPEPFQWLEQWKQFNTLINWMTGN